MKATHKVVLTIIGMFLVLILSLSSGCAMELSASSAPSRVDPSEESAIGGSPGAVQVYVDKERNNVCYIVPFWGTASGTLSKQYAISCVHGATP